jgi:hypothetical protein
MLNFRFVQPAIEITFIRVYNYGNAEMHYLLKNRLILRFRVVLSQGKTPETELFGNSPKLQRICA